MDELCNIIRRGCNLEDFKNACQEFHISNDDKNEEVKAGDIKHKNAKHQDIDNEFFSIIGT